ncbi:MULTISPECIES: hypothetical protein [unclassified Sphingomonas]|uniref:hypothetical protein n=1 Tax=unclassified Sphingomonas TaxID=196159 RepID=UPI0010F95F6E|nr:MULTISPECIES: hypothetical protein [unclassified Sphingomonas]
MTVRIIGGGPFGQSGDSGVRRCRDQFDRSQLGVPNISQHGSKRPLQLRLAPARTLHDRLLIADKSKAWILTQSLKDLAARSPATLQQVDAELSAMKWDAYSQIWDASQAII